MDHYDVEAAFFTERRTEVLEWEVVAAHRVLAPWIKDRFKIAFNSPKQFNKTGSVSTDTFLKVLQQLGPNGTLSEEKMMQLINTFASKCSANDWNYLYQPILKRVPFKYLSIGMFNSALHRHYMADGSELAPWHATHTIRPVKPQVREIGFPTGPGHFYPYDSSDKMVFIIMWKTVTDCIWADTYHQVDIHEEILHACADSRKADDALPYPIVFEAFLDNGNLVFTDMFPMAHINTWPGELRRQALEDFYTRYFSVSYHTVLGEGYVGSDKTDLTEVAEHMKSLGYKSLNEVMFKPADTTYQQPALLVPVFPLDGG